jgi:hypothetical protein
MCHALDKIRRSLEIDDRHNLGSLVIVAAHDPPRLLDEFAVKKHIDDAQLGHDPTAFWASPQSSCSPLEPLENTQGVGRIFSAMKPTSFPGLFAPPPSIDP